MAKASRKADFENPRLRESATARTQEAPADPESLRGIGLLGMRERVEVLEPGKLRHATEERAPRIIKTNSISIRPMSIEEAALRLDDSKNEFIVFRDIDTDRDGEVRFVERSAAPGQEGWSASRHAFRIAGQSVPQAAPA